MKSIKFPEVTHEIAKNQAEYETLYAKVGEFEGGGYGIIACFELNDQEIENIRASRKVWYRALTFGQPLQPFNILAVPNYFDCKVAGKPQEERIHRERVTVKASWWDRLKFLFKGGMRVDVQIRYAQNKLDDPIKPKVRQL